MLALYVLIAILFFVLPFFPHFFSSSENMMVMTKDIWWENEGLEDELRRKFKDGQMKTDDDRVERTRVGWSLDTVATDFTVWTGSLSN